MTHKITHDGAAVVNPRAHWMPIDGDTPRGAKLLLISQHYGVAHIGLHLAGDTYYTHWAPLPTFEKAEP